MRPSYKELLLNSGLSKQVDLVAIGQEEITEIEHKFGISLPSEYKSLLNICGKKAGLFFYDCDFFYPQVLHLQEELAEMLDEEGMDIKIPRNALVFSAYQGFQYLYFICDSDDPPVYRITDGGKEPTLVAPTFSSFIRNAISQYTEALREY